MSGDNPNAGGHGNRITVETLLRGIVERDHIDVRYVTGLMAEGGTTVTVWDGICAT